MSIGVTPAVSSDSGQPDGCDFGHMLSGLVNTSEHTFDVIGELGARLRVVTPASVGPCDDRTARTRAARSTMSNRPPQAASPSWIWASEVASSLVKFTRITVDPKRMGGVPCVRNLRFPIATVVAMVADGMAVDEILDEHPDLEAEDIAESLRYAALAVQERELPLRQPA